jgi:hypothetical protein
MIFFWHKIAVMERSVVLLLGLILFVALSNGDVIPQQIHLALASELFFSFQFHKLRQMIKHKWL